MTRSIFVSALVLALGTGPLLTHAGQGKPAGRPKMEHPRPTTERSTAAAEHSKPTTHAKMTVGEHLKHNTKLQTKVQGLLPAGTDMDKASAGFKNLGQFVSAAHVSHNLDIPFDQLKARMIAGDDLGEAIHALKPDVDARAEARKAQKQAEKDIKELEKS